LEEQHFAIRAQVCGGIGCPPKEIIDQFQLPTFSTNRLANFPKPNPVVIPTREIECFCLELFVVGHFEVVGPVGGQRLLAKLDGLEIVNIQPEGLENSIECYLRLLVQLVLLPRTSVALSNIVLDIYDPVSVVLKPSTSVPNNPAIEEDQLKVFIDLEVLP
jgi:hypothetical protein